MTSDNRAARFAAIDARRAAAGVSVDMVCAGARYAPRSYYRARRGAVPLPAALRRLEASLAEILRDTIVVDGDGGV